MLQILPLIFYFKINSKMNKYSNLIENVYLLVGYRAYFLIYNIKIIL